MTLASIPKSLREQVAARDAGRCRYCSLAQFGQAAMFHVDHVVPRSAGGTTTLDNLVLQCPNCSLRKSNKIWVIDPTTDARHAMFRPLAEWWEDHFALLDDGSVVGRTPTGRGTVAALAINDPRPRLARSLQIALGIIAPSPGTSD